MSAHRRPIHLSHLTIIGIVLLGGTVNLAQIVHAGATSGLGLLTMAQCAAVWLLWAHRPSLPASHRPLLPLLLFVVYALLSAFYNVPTSGGVQNLLAMCTCIGAALLTAREVENFPSLVPRIARAFEWASLFGIALYVAHKFVGLPEAAFSVRGFALFSLLALANHLALWRYGARRGLVMAVVIMLLVFDSMSRLALVAGALMFPLAVVIHGHRRALLQTILISVVAAAGLGAAVFLNERMYDRFFAEDANLQVGGGVAINTTGRMYVWEEIYDSFLDHPILGQGAGSTAPYTDIEGMGHPHNDFLRQAHDYGVIGLALWVSGMVALAVRMSGSARRPYAAHDPLSLAHVAALLALFSVFASMFTDNPISYVFIMGPLGVMIGASFGLARRQAAEAGVVDASRSESAFELARGGAIARGS